MISVCRMQEKSCKYTGRVWQFDSTKCTETSVDYESLGRKVRRNSYSEDYLKCLP